MPTDADMQRIFGVSRIVSREVIKTLAAKGLVASRMTLGNVVLDPTHWNWLDTDVLSWRASVALDAQFVEHVTEVRRAIEPFAAALAAERHSRAELKALREAIEDMRKAGQDRWSLAEADVSICWSARSPTTRFSSLSAV